VFRSKSESGGLSSPFKSSTNHAKSKRFNAIVDTGSDYCLFDANIGASIGIKIVGGPEGPLGGIIPGVRGKVYYHNVRLVVAADIVDIKAGFSGISRQIFWTFRLL
jgi:hypothetical protein